MFIIVIFIWFGYNKRFLFLNVCIEDEICIFFNDLIFKFLNNINIKMYIFKDIIYLNI